MDSARAPHSMQSFDCVNVVSQFQTFKVTQISEKTPRSYFELYLSMIMPFIPGVGRDNIMAFATILALISFA